MLPTHGYRNHGWRCNGSGKRYSFHNLIPCILLRSRLFLVFSRYLSFLHINSEISLFNDFNTVMPIKSRKGANLRPSKLLSNEAVLFTQFSMFLYKIHSRSSCKLTMFHTFTVFKHINANLHYSYLHKTKMYVGSLKSPIPLFITITLRILLASLVSYSFQ